MLRGLPVLGKAGLQGRGFLDSAGKGRHCSHTLGWLLDSIRFPALVSAMCSWALAPLGKHVWFFNNFPIYFFPLWCVAAPSGSSSLRKAETTRRPLGPCRQGREPSWTWTPSPVPPLDDCSPADGSLPGGPEPERPSLAAPEFLSHRNQVR